MPNSDDITGHCLCGACGFAYSGAPRFMAHCHCESCRRATASPFTSFIGVPDGQWRWTGETPVDFASSPGVIRSFYPHCGSQIAYRADRFPGEIHFYAALLDDPGHFRPMGHVHTDEMLPWLHLCDDLPRT
ncbi:GFA family protein [Marimonas arenosa]|uniref:GFA family protein n=1 Tax=Marimonas arenosa TaxID=1795305 RepID=A0AAE4B451_9RHOB|nr:GFA family protein [Marimonas arenosa]MDQ2090708.1 GFA family protein [Marimonas arenosa]